MTPKSKQLQEAADYIGKALTTLGIPIGGEHMSGTPRRVARAWAEMMCNHDVALIDPETLKFNPGSGIKLATFKAPANSQLVVVRDISFTSVCAHHLMPFYGKVSIGYIPMERILGLSKFARIVEHCSKAPQTQEHLTTQIACSLGALLEARCVCVYMEATHTCMSCRGACATGASTVTSFYWPHENIETKKEFLALLK